MKWSEGFSRWKMPRQRKSSNTGFNKQLKNIKPASWIMAALRFNVPQWAKKSFWWCNILKSIQKTPLPRDPWFNWFKREETCWTTWCEQTTTGINGFAWTTEFLKLLQRLPIIRQISSFSLTPQEVYEKFCDNDLLFCMYSVQGNTQPLAWRSYVNEKGKWIHKKVNIDSKKSILKDVTIIFII